MIVLDASAAIELFLGLPRAAPMLRARLSRAGESVHVPHLFDLEALATIRRYALIGQLAEHLSDGALDALDDLRATRYAHAPFRRRIWQLRDNLTPYDAAYVALAEALRAPLVTLDGHLARACGSLIDVELVAG